MKLQLLAVLALLALVHGNAEEPRRELAGSRCPRFDENKCMKRRIRKRKGCTWSNKFDTCIDNRNVWFVGNSFTKNAKVNMPKYFLELVERAKTEVATKVSTGGGLWLADHAKDSLGDMEDWWVKFADNLIVLQEQSQVPMYTSARENHMLPAAEAFKAKAETMRGTRIMLFETWGYNYGDSYADTYANMQSRVTGGYAWLSDQLGDIATVCPVGQAWAAMMSYLEGENIDTMVMYRESDAKHASELGHYLVANALFACILQQSPEGINWRPSGMNSALAAEARAQAARVVLG